MSVNDSYTPPTTESSKPLDVSSAPPTAAANVPDLMKIGAMPINTQMEVETDILDPIVFSETFCRYRLQNKGILHSNSKLTFGLDVSSGSNAKTILPPNIGIHSIIDRAVLKVGTKTICETDGFNHFMNFRSSFVNPQHNKQRESVTSSRMMCRKWDYDLGEEGGVSASGRVDSINLASKYTLDTGFEISSLNTSLSASYNYDVHQYSLLNAVASRNSGTGTSDYQITINDLFPFLKMNQLPLYMMKEEIDIELFFTAEKKRAVTIGTVTGATYSCKLVRSDCRLIADYIYYPQEIMTAYQNANSNMSFTYVDYRLVKHTVDATGGAAQKIILNVGGAGRVVNKVFFGLAPPDTTANPDRLLMNLYESAGPRTTAGGELSGISHNLRFNDQFLYPIDIKNNTRLFHNIQQAEGSVPFISKDEYVDELKLISDIPVFGYDLEGATSGANFWIEDRLNRNERVNSRGIEIYQTWDKLPTLAFTMRTWLETVKYATLSDGVLQTYYA